MKTLKYLWVIIKERFFSETFILSQPFSRFTALIFCLLCTGLAGQTPSQTENYIYVQEPTEEVSEIQSSTDALRTIQYFDGLGRPKQIIQIKGNTVNNADVVTHIAYDGFGRQDKEYLPWPLGQSNGAIVNPTTLETNTVNYYKTRFPCPDASQCNLNPYSQKEFENSPLNRIMAQGAPGDAWKIGSGNEIEFEYLTNTTADEVIIFQGATSWNSSEKYYDINLVKGKNGQKFYPNHTLYKSVVTDENGHEIIEFKNKQGQVILKRTFALAGKGITPSKHDTYYVYDVYGNLTYVIAPNLADLYVSGNNLPSDWQTKMNKLGYQYKYDSRNRLVEKRLPGKGKEFMVYDKQDRLIAVQDALMGKTTFSFPSGKTGKAWAFTKYDKFGRVIYTGLYKSTQTRSELQTLVDGASYGNNNEEYSSSSFSQNDIPVYYTKSGGFPKNHTSSNTDLLSVNYYDRDVTALRTADNVPLPTLTDVVIRDGGTSDTQSLKGMPVISYVNTLDDNGWEKNYTFYDQRARPVYSHKLNHLGGYTKVASYLDFRGKPNYTMTYHKRIGTDTEITIRDNFTYDTQERMVRHSQKINNLPEQLITYNSYDQLGMLQNKMVGGTNLTGGTGRWQQVDYDYNIRGWLTDINNVKQDIFGKDATPGTSDDLFAFRINYNFIEAPGSGISGSMATGLLNGNIAETYWKTSTDNTLRGYGYVYDEMNRLLHAQYVKPDALTPYPQNYDETLTYDKNGNIMTLLRKSGVDIPTGAMLTDNLTYTYESNGNRLMKVADATNSETGFKDGTNLGNDYAYDDNGNMISDSNKEINQILYNHLNLPTSITFANGSGIEYFYNAAGQKLRKTVNDTQNNTIKVVEYLDGFQYAGGVLQFFPHAEGYVAATQGTKTDENGNLSYIFNYVYNYTDHLGNIRLSYTKDPVSGELEIMEENHYYPFGLKHDVYAPPQQKYELDEEDENLARPAFVFETEYHYKYNGKEFQDELNLNWLDYGWRNYMPDLGRWVTPDPLLNDLKTTIDFDRIMNETDDDINMLIAFASKMEVGGGVYNPNNLNPFSYGYNNPVSFDDPDGRCPICIVGVFLLFGGSVAMNSTGDHDGDQQKIQTAVSTQRNILVGTATGGAGTARGTVTTVVGASKNSGNANKTQTVQKGTQKTQNTKTSSKNEKHGDGGKQLSKSDKQIKQLESQKEGATKKEVKQINQKIKNIRENAQKSKKGEEHSRTNKR